MSSLFSITLLRTILTTKAPSWKNGQVSCTAFICLSLNFLRFIFSSSFSDSKLSRFFAIYILATLETRAFIAFYPRSIPQFSSNPNGAPARSRFFHVLPPGSDKSRYRPPPPHTISCPSRAASVFPRRIFGWKFERRPEKQESGKQTRGNWIVKGVVVPRIYRVRTIRRDSRLFIA